MEMTTFNQTPDQTFDQTKVPELSFAQYLHGDARDRALFIEELFRGLKYFGFIILKDHGVPVSLIEQAYKQSEALFALPEATKIGYISKAGGGQRGYTPFGKEHAKNSKVPDLKEFWHVGREVPANDPDVEFFPENIGPVELPNFEKTFSQLFHELDVVGEKMLEALTQPLKVPSDHFTKMIRNGSSVLRLLHYPPIPEGVDPRCVRAAAHEDINLITILVAASASGLELLDRDGQWLPVETDANNLIVDAGDMLARVTNDVIPSTTHRVVNPQGANVSRYSMPFFIHPHPRAVLSCIESCRGPGAKYADISSQDFLFERLREIGLV